MLDKFLIVPKIDRAVMSENPYIHWAKNPSSPRVVGICRIAMDTCGVDRCENRIEGRVMGSETGTDRGKRKLILMLAGISDVLIAGVLLVLTMNETIAVPILVPALLLVAGIGMVIAAALSG